MVLGHEHKLECAKHQSQTSEALMKWAEVLYFTSMVSFSPCEKYCHQTNVPLWQVQKERDFSFSPLTLAHWNIFEQRVKTQGLLTQKMVGRASLWVASEENTMREPVFKVSIRVRNLKCYQLAKINEWSEQIFPT